MKAWCALLAAALICSGTQLARADGTNAPPTGAPVLPPELAAIHDWLAELDGGEYERCWNDSAKLARDMVSLKDSIAYDQHQAQAWGACVRRQFGGARAHTRIRRPDGSQIEGEFIEAEFTTDFEKQKGVTEHVSSMKEPDGVWRVFAYDARANPG